MDSTIHSTTDYRYTGIIEYHVKTRRITARIQRETLQATSDGHGPIVTGWEPDHELRISEPPQDAFALDVGATLLDGWEWDLDKVFTAADWDNLYFYIQDPRPRQTT